MKAKCFKFLGLMIAPAAIIFPWLNYKDRNLKIVDLEGSGSLFEPILSLTKGEQYDTQLNILPTGSAGGKESLTDNSINLALTSLSSKKIEDSVVQLKEVRIAEDPIVLVHKKNPNCSLFVEKQTNDKLPEEIFKLELCKNLVLFLREGGYERSNLNKTVLSKELKLNFNISQIREVPENNFLAFEKFRRENYSDSIIFFPKSFVELNRELFSDYETKELKAETSKKQSLSLQKELNLLYRQGEERSKNDLWEIIKKILLKAKDLGTTFKLTPKNYFDSSIHGPKFNNGENSNAEDINQLKKK